MKVVFAGKCAWRGIYVKAGKKQGIVFSMTVDPNGGVQPSLTVGILVGFNSHGYPQRRFLRIPLPFIPWRYNLVKRQPFLTAYHLSQKFWHGVDGRYGWFTK